MYRVFPEWSLAIGSGLSVQCRQRGTEWRHESSESIEEKEREERGNAFQLCSLPLDSERTARRALREAEMAQMGDGIEGEDGESNRATRCIVKTMSVRHLKGRRWAPALSWAHRDYSGEEEEKGGGRERERRERERLQENAWMMLSREYSILLLEKKLDNWRL